MLTPTNMMLAYAVVLGLPASASLAAAPVSAPHSAHVDAAGPRAAWLDADPGDSLYRAARATLLRNDYRSAARQFGELAAKYPRSGYAPDALYWQAFALYRLGGTANLRAAAAAADRAHTFTKWKSSSDLATLTTRIDAALARSGDPDAAAAIASAADAAAEAPEPPEAPEAPEAPGAPGRPDVPRPPRAPRAPGWTGTRNWVGRGDDGRCRGDGDDDVKAAALNGLLQMDADRALPILRKLLARRDDASTCLRRRAVFLVAQKRGPDTEEILLNSVRNDPDAEVRSQGVFWLSQVPSARATTALDSILRASKDDDVRDRAIFALSQQQTPEALAALRGYASRTDQSTELRAKAIFWLGQRSGGSELPFLRELYGKLDNDELKEKVLFSASQGGNDGQKLLLDVARNGKESIALRKQSLFWLGQSHSVSGEELVSLYGTFSDREMRDQLIFALSQRHDAASVDKLIVIARKDPDAELRRKAIFWLGQSRDPRAVKAIEEILDQ